MCALYITAYDSSHWDGAQIQHHRANHFTQTPTAKTRRNNNMLCEYDALDYYDGGCVIRDMSYNGREISHRFHEFFARL